MSRSKWLVVLILITVLYLFHSRYVIVPQSDAFPPHHANDVNNGVGGGRQSAASAISPLSALTTERHVGAEDPAGHVFVPQTGHKAPKAVGFVGGGGGGGGGGVDAHDEPGRQRSSPFLRGLSPGKGFWMFCAKQYHSCSCAGTIRWGRGGVGGKWKEYALDATSAQQTLECSVNVLPDILPGDDAKHCECEMKVGDPVYEAITNPGILPPEAGAEQSPLLWSSCRIIQQMGAKGHETPPENTALLRSAEPLCSSEWPSSPDALSDPTGGKSGDRAMTLEQTRASMLAWKDELFEGAVVRLYDDAGWISRAFLT
jgi:hypothetical protein